MKPTHSEMERFLSKPKNGHSVLQDAQALYYLQQAAVHHEALTNSPEWDFFLSQLQTWAEKTEAQIAEWKSIISDPDMDDTRASQARKYLLLCQERASVLRSVISFPSEVIKAGEKAKLELEAIGGEAMAATKN